MNNITYFNNCFAKEGKDVEISYILNIIKSEKLKPHTDFLRNETNKDKRQEYKKRKLPAVTFSGTFSKRKNEALKESSGLMCLDYDEKITKEIVEIIKKDEYIYSYFKSPSGFLKMLVKIPKVTTNKEYSAYYKAIITYFNNKGIKLDIGTKDIVRLCYLSYDPNLYVNEESKEFTDKEKDMDRLRECPPIIDDTTKVKVETPKDSSRSATEYREVCKLLKQNKSKEEIFNHMCNFEKWNSSHDSYKETTYNKAFSFIEVTKKEGMPFDEFVKLVWQNIGLKDRETATELIVKRLYETYIFKTTKIDEKSEIWVYKNGIYEPQGRCEIQEQTRLILGKLYTTNLCNIIISKIEADTYIDQDSFFNQQNKYPELIPVLNGVLNIKTKELKEFTSEVAYFNKIPITYNPNVKSKKFIGFVKEITKEDNDIKIIQELFGYSLYKKYKYKKSFMFEGNGDNGKSQLLKILTEHFLGIENTKEVSLAQMEKDKFIVGELHNKLVNVSADITTSVVENTGMFKNLTGGDPISVSRKFKNTISFVSYAKMVFATNELPISKDNSDGFWSRWILLEFPHKFLEQKNIDALPEEEKDKVKVATPNIVDTIVSEEEMTGVLNWALDGFERLRKNKGFSDNNGREQTKKKWLMKANSVLSFIDEHIEEDYDSYIIKNDFKQEYLRYCKEHKLTRKSDKVIKITLENELSAFSSTKYIVDTQKYVWEGVKFKQVKQVKHPFPTLGRISKTSLESKPMLKLPKLPNKNSVFELLEKNKKGIFIDEIIKHFGSEYTESIERLLQKIKEEGEIFEVSPSKWQAL